MIAVAPEGFTFPPGRTSVTIASAAVDPAYFDTLGVRLVQGRGFRETDRADGPWVAIVDETFAARYLGANPLGRRLRFVELGDRTAEVVGISRRAPQFGLHAVATVHLPAVRPAPGVARHARRAHRRRAHGQAAVLAELNQMSFRDFQGALKRFHAGSLSIIHLNLLMLLRFNGPLTMSRLAELLDVSVASATGIVDRMEKKGVIERRRSDEDRRVVVVHVSETGQQVFTAMQVERQAHMARMLSGISDKDLQALLTGLRAVREARDKWLSQHAHEERQQA